MDDKVFCSNCGKQISKTAKFCPYCGAANREYASSINDTAASNGANQQQTQNVQSSPTVNQNATQVTKSSKPRQHYKLTRGKLVALIVGLIVIVGAGVFGVKQYYGNRYDIYSMPRDSNTDTGPDLHNLKFIPKTYIQINDHEVDAATLIVPSDKPKMHFLVASHIPIIKQGSKLHLDYDRGKLLSKLYLSNQFLNLENGVPKSDMDQFNLLKNLVTSDDATDGVTSSGKVTNMVFSFPKLTQENFNSRDQIIRYFYGTHSHVTKFSQNKEAIDFNEGASSKNVKKTENYNQSVDRMYDKYYGY